MTSRKVAEVGPWAKEKLARLERYLDYYTKRLKNSGRRTVYLDAFAGGGVAVIRGKRKVEEPTGEFWEHSPSVDSAEIIRGSPQIALSLANPFSTYVFVDKNGDRVAQLEALQSSYSGTSAIHLRHESAEEAIDWVLARNIRKTTHRGVAFLDPFGGHLPWTSVEKLAATRFFEIVINFPLQMALNRLVTRDPVKMPVSWREQLTTFFGSDEWFSAAYERGTLLEGPATKRADAGERLLALYVGKLQRAFGYVSTPRVIRNTANGPLYFLIWAGPHPAGLVGAEYVMQMAAP